jgi:hypothetical protein
MNAPIGAVNANTAAKKTTICNQPFVVIKTSPETAARMSDKPEAER